ncbi:MAG: ribbon-helix-helix domain-containing protein [Kosmotogaceae bacterium]
MFSVRLDDELEEKVRSMAEKAKVSKSEIVREALTEYLEARETEERPYELGQDLFGRFGSGVGDLSTTYKARIKEKLHEKSLD